MPSKKITEVKKSESIFKKIFEFLSDVFATSDKTFIEDTQKTLDKLEEKVKSNNNKLFELNKPRQYGIQHPVTKKNEIDKKRLKNRQLENLRELKRLINGVDERIEKREKHKANQEEIKNRLEENLNANMKDMEAINSNERSNLIEERKLDQCNKEIFKDKGQLKNLREFKESIKAVQDIGKNFGRNHSYIAPRTKFQSTTVEGSRLPGLPAYSQTDPNNKINSNIASLSKPPAYTKVDSNPTSPPSYSESYSHPFGPAPAYSTTEPIKASSVSINSATPPPAYSAINTMNDKTKTKTSEKPLKSAMKKADTGASKKTVIFADQVQVLEVERDDHNVVDSDSPSPQKTPNMPEKSGGISR